MTKYVVVAVVLIVLGGFGVFLVSRPSFGQEIDNVPGLEQAVSKYYMEKHQRIVLEQRVFFCAKRFSFEDKYEVRVLLSVDTKAEMNKYVLDEATKQQQALASYVDSKWSIIGGTQSTTRAEPCSWWNQFDQL